MRLWEIKKRLLFQDSLFLLYLSGKLLPFFYQPDRYFVITLQKRCKVNSRHCSQFFTATIYQWNHLLRDNRHKDIIIDSLKFLVTDKPPFASWQSERKEHRHWLNLWIKYFNQFL